MTTLLFLCLLGYLIGSIPTGKIVSYYKGIDIQTVGTGNIGASNTFSKVGKKAGFIVLLGDIGKAYMMLKVALLMVGVGQALLVGLFLLLGNTRSIFLKFKGGKGVATSLGVFLATEPIVAIVMVLFWGASLFFIRYILISAIIGSMLIPYTYYRYEYDNLSLVCSAMICLILLISHKTNFMIKDRKGPQIPKAS